MGNFFSRLFSCFSSSSPPPNNITETIRRPSGPPQSSHPSQPPPIAEPSTPINTDLEKFLQKFNDISHLHNLIQFIEELLKIASGEKSEEGSSSAASSYIQDGQTILELVDKHIGKNPGKKDFMDGASVEVENVVIELLKGVGKIHWVGAALSVVGFVLARFSQMSTNKTECLEILKRMFNLGKQILQLNDQMPEQKQKLNEAAKCIVEGCTICASQLATVKIFRFLTASVNAESLKAFQQKIDRLHDDLLLSGMIEIEKRQPKFAPPSQEDYGYKQAVGFGSAQADVIRLLESNAQDPSPQVVVVHGFGGIGKTTLADAVYARIDLKPYKHCRIYMEQNCTNSDLKVLQEQILDGLFRENWKLRDCDEGQGKIWTLCKKKPNQPLFLYIDNGLRKEDLRKLLPADLGDCLPPKSRILVTTRFLQETDIFVAWKIQRREYPVSALPQTEAAKILLKNVPEYKDERNIDDLFKLCGGVPFLLEIAGSQLAISTRKSETIEVLEMLKDGEKVEKEDISERMVDIVYKRLSPREREAFLDITPFFYHYWKSEEVAFIVGEKEFRALEEASFVKTSEGGHMIVHDIVRARGKKISEQNRITDTDTLMRSLKDEEKLRNLKGIFFKEKYEQSPVEITENHLNCMSNSLRVLSYNGSQITFMGKCLKPFKELRCLNIPRNVPDLPMEFDELENLVYYRGPFTQGMSLYEFPRSLRYLYIEGSSNDMVTYSKNPPQVTPACSVVSLCLNSCKNMERLPDGVEKLTKLECLYLIDCHELRELPSKMGELSNLKKVRLCGCHELKKLPSDFGQQLINMEELDLSYCYGLEEWPLNFENLTKMKKLVMIRCSSKLKESVPRIRGSCSIEVD